MPTDDEAMARRDRVSANELRARACVPCRGDTQALNARESASLRAAVPSWDLVVDAGPSRLRRTWKVKSFLAGLDFFRAVAVIAEADDHHPDLHLVDYRVVTIEISTHTVRGLSINDFILAAKIDALPMPAP